MCQCFRQLQALLQLFKGYFHIEDLLTLGPDRPEEPKCIDGSTIWQRFHEHVVASLPRRKVVIATDATGFSGRKVGWREADHAVKATRTG